MATQVIQTKRQPAIWSVKAGGRHRALFSGVGGGAQAEAYAAENYGTFEVLAKPPTGKEIKRGREARGKCLIGRHSYYLSACQVPDSRRCKGGCVRAAGVPGATGA